MSFLQLTFYIFSLILVFAAGMVVTVRNPVKSALFLVLAFFSAACIWITLPAEFLAIVLVLVYVGAVMVLFRGEASLKVDKMVRDYNGYDPQLQPRVKTTNSR